MQVARILRSQGIPRAPRRSQTTWREFVRQHTAQMLAFDFSTVGTPWLQRLHTWPSSRAPTRPGRAARSDRLMLPGAGRCGRPPLPGGVRACTCA